MWKLELSKSEGDGNRETSVNNHTGRQYWQYHPDIGSPFEVAKIEQFRHAFHENRLQVKHSSDLLMRFQFENEKLASGNGDGEEEKEDDDQKGVTGTLRRALRYYSTLQADDGHWPGDYAGPLFLLPGLVMGLYVTGALNTVLSPHHLHEIRRYMYNHQLQYVSLRLIGEEMDGGDGAMQKARKWILDHGGATFIPSWGKLWLSVIGVYDWSGNNPLPPEIWLLPYILPIHPGRMWCHSRMVYLPMSFLYGRKFVGAIDATILSLRKELYTGPYHLIDWDRSRFLCAEEDLYNPHSYLQDLLWDAAHKLAEPLLNKWPFSKLRTKALDIAMKHIHYEDRNTNYICLGPVSKVLNMVCCWVEDPDSEEFKCHLSRIKDYLWVAEDGMKMQGYNGSQLWDVAFSVQAVLATNLPDEYGSMLHKAHSLSKIRKTNSPGNLSSWYRHISKGGWPFSTPDNGWITPDCTAEGLKAALLLSRCSTKNVGEAISDERLYDAVNVLLSLQNGNGGYASYELTRSYAWLEVINPAETFRDIMIDYQYVECTSAPIQALKAFSILHPEHRKKQVSACIAKGADFIQSIQLPDGSWYGSWGVCFTYGTWFGIKGLVAAGKTYDNCDSVRRACEFLLSKQLDTGGWGESYLSCQDKVYTNLEGNRSHIVNTSWAMLALIQAAQGDRDIKPLHRAANVLMSSQMENGDFPQQEIMGVFNKNCMISYSAYRNIFPIWALGEYRNLILRS